MSPTIELLSEHVDTTDGRLAAAVPGMSYATLRRIYSIEGLRPVRVQVSNKPDGKPWAVQVDVLGPDMKWTVILFSQSAAPQDGYGEDEADRLAALAARLQVEASR